MILLFPCFYLLKYYYIFLSAGNILNVCQSKEADIILLIINDIYIKQV